MKDRTISVHGGLEIDKTTHSRALPIYQTTAYTFDDTKYAAELFSLERSGNIYTRLMNPTTDVLEKRMALLDGGVAALATASGMAAITYAVLNIASQGDEIISSTAIYGGTHTLFNDTLPKLGITTKFVDPDNFVGIERAITSKTKLIFAETLANPKLNVLDIEKLAAIAHKHGIPLILDNTVPTPALLKPISFGADIVVYSATKFIGGHGNSMCGIIVDSGKFNWANGKFPELTEPDSSYHGISYTQTFKTAAYIVKARVKLLRDTGAALSPFNAFLVAQGLETLPLRMKAHSENALKVAEFLENHEKVSWVIYPGLKSHKDYELAKKYYPNGCASMIGFGVKGGKICGARFIDNVKLLSHVANIGDTKSLVIHPASTTHQQLSVEDQIAAGAPPDYIRLSVGIEDPEDIIEDIKQALENC